MERVKQRLAIWDLDSTLMGTGFLFPPAIDEVVDFLRKCSGADESIKDRFNLHQMEVRRIHHVNPRTIWPLTLEALQQEYKLTGDQCNKALEIIMRIYTKLPLLYPGIRDVLVGLKGINFEQSVLTHAEPEWTDFKVDGHDLRPHFQKIIIVDVKGPKASSDWKQAVYSHGVGLTDEVWAIGDNVTADVQAALDAGISNVIHADFDSGDRLTRNGQLDKRAYVAKYPSDILQIIKKKLTEGGEGGI